MAVFENASFDDHELVNFVSDRESGLRAIIAIHSTVMGPAGGGVRMYPYPSSAEALHDVLRLSRAMTCKIALLGLPAGGGKTVVIGDPRRDKSEAVLEALGRAVEQLGGRYICAEDVGTTPEDMAVIRRTTSHVTGLPDQGGDTSPLTGYGVFHAIRSAVRHRLGRDGLDGVTVAIQGAGGVGRSLAPHLASAGARISIADVVPEAARRVAEEVGGTVVSPEQVLSLDVDVLAPCALGAVLNDETLPGIRAAIICGGANNQLGDDRHGQTLHERGILFVPDYVANSGGVISGVAGLMGLGEEEARKRAEEIYDTCMRVFERAEREGVSTNQAAERMAREIVEAAAAQED